MGNVYAKLLALAEKKTAKAIAEESKIGKKTIDAVKDVKKTTNNTPKGKSRLGADEPTNVKMGERENTYLNKPDQLEIEQLKAWDNRYDYQPKPTLFINKSVPSSLKRSPSSQTIHTHPIKKTVGGTKEPSIHPKQSLEKKSIVKNTDHSPIKRVESEEKRVIKDETNAPNMENQPNVTSNSINKGEYKETKKKLQIYDALRLYKRSKGLD